MDGAVARLHLVVHCLLQRDHNGSTPCQQGRTRACLYLWIEAVHQGQRKSTCSVELADELDGHHDVFVVV